MTNDLEQKPTSETDALLDEHSKLRSNTLQYPTEQALIKLARNLERQRDALMEALEWALPRIAMTNEYPAVLGMYHHSQELIASIKSGKKP